MNDMLRQRLLVDVCALAINEDRFRLMCDRCQDFGRYYAVFVSRTMVRSDIDRVRLCELVIICERYRISHLTMPSVNVIGMAKLWSIICKTLGMMKRMGSISEDLESQMLAGRCGHNYRHIFLNATLSVPLEPPMTERNARIQAAKGCKIEDVRTDELEILVQNQLHWTVRYASNSTIGPVICILFRMYIGAIIVVPI